MKRARMPGTFSVPADIAKTSEGGYLTVLGMVGDRRDLVWGSMTYGCTDTATPARPVPPGWDRIVEQAPAGYWDERGGVPETIELDGRRFFPAKPAGCGHEERYYLGLGVEGPGELRERMAFIPCPFVAGSCPRCGRSMSHVRWSDDETFDEPYGPPPSGARYFRVPDETQAREWASKGYGGAELVAP
jgi:hypothetical protein